MDIWQSITKTPKSDSSIAANQKIWCYPLQLIAAEAVLPAAQTPASRARLIAAAAPSSGAFLQAIPMSSVDTRLNNTSMRIAVSLRLGAPLCTPHDYRCVMYMDTFVLRQCQDCTPMTPLCARTTQTNVHRYSPTSMMSCNDGFAHLMQDKDEASESW